MVRKRHLDNFKVAQASDLAARVGPIFGEMGGGFGGGSIFSSGAGKTSNLALRKEQVKNYTFWTYIAIKRISDKFSEPFPMVGTPIDATTSSTSRMSFTPEEADHIQRFYGSRIIQSAFDELEPLPSSHPFRELLYRVNGTEDADAAIGDTWSEFAFETSMFLHLTGTFYWWVIPDMTGQPVQLWVIPTNWVTEEVFTKSGRMTHIVMQPPGSSRDVKVPAEEVAKYKFKSPLSKLEGYSPMLAAPQWIDNMAAIAKSQFHAFKNGTNPDMIVQLGNAFTNPDKERMSQLQDKFITWQTGVENAGRPFIFPPEEQIAKWERWSNMPSEMDYLNSSNMIRDEVLSIFGVPKTVTGITESVNRASFEGSMVAFAEITMNPLLRQFAGFLTERIASRFDPNIRVWYKDIAPRNAVQVLEDDRFAFQSGALNPDEIRLKQGRKALGTEEMQKGYLPGGFVPVDFHSAEKEAERASIAAESSAKKRFEDAGVTKKAEEDESSNGKLPNDKKKQNSNGMMIERML